MIHQVSPFMIVCNFLCHRKKQNLLLFFQEINPSLPSLRGLSIALFMFLLLFLLFCVFVVVFVSIMENHDSTSRNNFHVICGKRRRPPRRWRPTLVHDIHGKECRLELRKDIAIMNQFCVNSCWNFLKFQSFFYQIQNIFF